MLDRERQCRVCDAWVLDICEEHEFREHAGKPIHDRDGKHIPARFYPGRVQIKPGLRPSARYQGVLDGLKASW